MGRLRLVTRVGGAVNGQRTGHEIRPLVSHPHLVCGGGRRARACFRAISDKVKTLSLSLFGTSGYVKMGRLPGLGSHPLRERGSSLGIRALLKLSYMPSLLSPFEKLQRMLERQLFVRRQMRGVALSSELREYLILRLLEMLRQNGFQIRSSLRLSIRIYREIPNSIIGRLRQMPIASPTGTIEPKKLTRN